MIKIPDQELEYTFSRSGGKGGQNVNKVSSRVQLRWNIRRSKIISEIDKEYLENIFGRRLTSRGEVMVDCDENRTQFANSLPDN